MESFLGESLAPALARANLVRWLGALIPLCFFWAGLFFDISSQDSDHGAHLAVVQELISGRYWPPPYHGILGLHAPSALLYEFFGLNPLRFGMVCSGGVSPGSLCVYIRSGAEASGVDC